MLVQEHAKLVSRFIKNGRAEIHKPYTLPKVHDEHSRKKSNSTATGKAASPGITPPRP